MKLMYKIEFLSFFTVLIALLFALSAHAGKYTGQERLVRVHNAWARATTPTMRTSVVYMKLENFTDTSDGLMGASTPIARRVELHQSVDYDGIMQMEHLDEIAIPRQGITLLEPGGYHLMLVDVQEQLQPGTEFPLTLEFVNTPERNVRVRVKPLSYTGKEK